jgi:uracil-DNA glycosylase
MSFAAETTAARACTLCAPALPHGCRPVFQLAPTARLLLIGQAPGRRVHASGRPFTDASGDQLRRWLGLEAERFYDAGLVAILPMGLCYPGTENGGDLPPRPECAPLWHPRLMPLLASIRLTVLIGTYAHARYRPGHRSVADTVATWRDDPAVIPIPHPSPRNRRWLSLHPWFEAEAVPALQAAVAKIIS